MTHPREWYNNWEQNNVSHLMERSERFWEALAQARTRGYVATQQGLTIADAMALLDWLAQRCHVDVSVHQHSGHHSYNARNAPCGYSLNLTAIVSGPGKQAPYESLALFGRSSISTERWTVEGYPLPEDLFHAHLLAVEFLLQKYPSVLDGA